MIEKIAEETHGFIRENWELAKPVLDWLSVAGAWAALFDMLPHLASALSVIWIALRIRQALINQGFIRGRRRRSTDDDDE